MNNPTINVPLVTTRRSLAPLNAALASLLRIIGDAGQAKPSPTSHTGGAFTVDFAQTTQPQPPFPPAAQDRLSHSPSQTSRAGNRATVGDVS